MTAIAKALSRALPATQIDVDTLKALIVFCGTGLVLSLLLGLSGVNIEAGLF